MQGIFISLEGPDGSGKSTAAPQIIDALKKQTNREILLTREPGGSRISEKIRKLILDVHNMEMDDRTEALLYAAQRRQHLVDVILPALKAGKIVVSDRYVDSSVAYQGAGREIGEQQVWDLNMFAINGILPQITLYFDIDPKIGLNRIANKRARPEDRLEKERIEFHERVHKSYLKLLAKNPDRIKKVNANQTPDKVVSDSVKILEDNLSL